MLFDTRDIYLQLLMWNVPIFPEIYIDDIIIQPTRAFQVNFAEF